MNAIISMMWDRQGRNVLESHLAANPAVIYTRSGFAGTQEPVHSRLVQRGIRVVLLPSLLTPGIIAGLQAQAATRARRITDDLTDDAVATAFAHLPYDAPTIRRGLTARLATRLYDALATVESIVLAAERHRIDLVIVNNDVEMAERAAIAWARSAGVRTLHLAHSIGSPHAEPQFSDFHAEILAIPGENSRYLYEGLDIDPERFVLTGWPAFDDLPALLDQRETIRSDFRQRRGIAAQQPVVVFATSWFSGFGAIEYPGVLEDTIRKVFAAMCLVRECYPDVRLVIKDRSVNARHRALLDSLGVAAGFGPGSWTHVEGDPLTVLIAADILICVHSSMATEAAVIGIPAISMWHPASWLVGPFFSGDDGVIEVPPERLADAVLGVLDDPEPARAALVDGRLGREGILVDGRCSERLSALMQTLRARSTHVVEPGASRSVSRADVGDTRRGVVDAIASARCVLDVRCGNGRRAQRLRERWPAARFIGLDADPANVRSASAFFDTVAVGWGSGEDIAALDVAPRSVDVAFLFDVLAFVDDPAATLRRLRSVLMDSARVYISLASSRSAAAVTLLADGHDLAGPGGAYAYDARHRFTLSSTVALLAACGFTVERAEGVPDPFSRLPAAPPDARALTFTSGRFTFKDIAPNELAELRASELLLTACVQC